LFAVTTKPGTLLLKNAFAKMIISIMVQESAVSALRLLLGTRKTNNVFVAQKDSTSIKPLRSVFVL
jgi:multisubunit Na+/H+ antiporter MnhC subunit